MARDLSKLEKLRASMPWLLRYPFWRARASVRRFTTDAPSNIILVVANHFEPAWNESVDRLSWSAQMQRLNKWYKQARRIGAAIRDHDGTPFRHTNFYPGEQYHKGLLDRLAEMQAEGLGEVEVHLHHGVDRPDTAPNLRHALEEFRDLLAEEHKCLSRTSDDERPMYGFVHGNAALANSHGGMYCGVDSEMQILADTGCYADFTLPCVYSPAQVTRINSIYECGGRLDEAVPHWSGPSLRVGRQPKLPIIFLGPTVLDWQHRRKGFAPAIDDGLVTANYLPDVARFKNWQSAGIGIRGRSDWIFVKLYCHGFFQSDDDASIGDTMCHFLEQVLQLSHQTGEFKLHFATAREAFNIAMAAIDGREGEPGLYRDYQLTQIMAASGKKDPLLRTDRTAPQAPVTERMRVTRTG